MEWQIQSPTSHLLCGYTGRSADWKQASVLPVLYCQPCCRGNPHSIFFSFSGANFSKYLAVWVSKILYIPILSGYIQGLIMYFPFSTLYSLNWPGLSSHSGGYRAERPAASSPKETEKQPIRMQAQEARRAIVPKVGMEAVADLLLENGGRTYYIHLCLPISQYWVLFTANGRVPRVSFQCK